MKILQKFRRDGGSPSASNIPPTQYATESGAVAKRPSPAKEEPYSLYATQRAPKTVFTPRATPPAPEKSGTWSKDIASAWAALRPRPAPPAKGEVRTAERLEKVLLGVPNDLRLAFLVDLGLHAIAKGNGIEAEMFFATALLNVMRGHVTATADERGEMFEFVKRYDDQHDFTGTRALGPGIAAYEAQLEEIGANSAADYLGYVYLRHLREAPANLSDETRDARVEMLVKQYAPLRKNSFFSP